MSRTWVFDSEAYKRITDSRQEFLKRFLEALPVRQELRTALDAGCGTGFLSAYLAEMGLMVKGFDLREETVAEARRRYPDLDFLVGDVEDPRIRDLGQFDCVVCFGLLYHLENPFLAIRNLQTLTRLVLVVESMITPAASPIAALMNEAPGEDQGIHHVAFVPSEAALTKMLYHAGFVEVYRTTEFPNHGDFRSTPLRSRRRTVLLASNVPLRSPHLSLVPEPEPGHQDIWRKGIARIGLGVWLRAVKARIRGVRDQVRPRIPIPWPVRLRWGSWWLTWGDVIDRHLADFEQGEQLFLHAFLKPGMVFVDVGAHHGLYTILGSKRVQPTGMVVAFEPSRREVKRLRWNLAINRCRNVRLEPVALGSADTESELFICDGQETALNSLRPPATTGPVKRDRVAVTTLDHYVERHAESLRRIDVMKLDVEGGEFNALIGARETLTQMQPIVLCELVDMRTQPWGYQSREIYQLLVSMGYRWFSLCREGTLRPSPSRQHYHDNLVAVPNQKLGLVENHLAAKAS